MHCKSYSHFFSKKFQHIFVSLDANFNESLTNDVVSFEQLGPDKYLSQHTKKGPSDRYVQSRIWVADMQFLPDISLRSLLHVCEQQRLVRLHLCTGSHEPLLVSYVISTVFSCDCSFFLIFFKKNYVEGTH